MTLMLNNNAKKWVKALRSGKYKQTTGTLGRIGKRGGESYCCLGVACEVAIKEGVKVKRTVNKDGFVSYDGADALLPTSVRKWLGLRTDAGDWAKNTGPFSGSLSMITEFGASFKDVADVIEAEPPRLFTK